MNYTLNDGNEVWVLVCNEHGICEAEEGGNCAECKQPMFARYLRAALRGAPYLNAS